MEKIRLIFKRHLVLSIGLVVAVAVVLATVVSRQFESSREMEASTPASPKQEQQEVSEVEKDTYPFISSIENGDAFVELTKKDKEALEAAFPVWIIQNNINQNVTLKVVKYSAEQVNGPYYLQLGSEERFIVVQKNQDGKWEISKLYETVEGVNENAKENPWIVEQEARQKETALSETGAEGVKELGSELEEARRRADEQAARDTRSDSSTPTTTRN